jgi:hypothetical protein
VISRYCDIATAAATATTTTTITTAPASPIIIDRFQHFKRF